jgi:hypothetical protein
MRSWPAHSAGTACGAAICVLAPAARPTSITNKRVSIYIIAMLGISRITLRAIPLLGLTFILWCYTVF